MLVIGCNLELCNQGQGCLCSASAMIMPRWAVLLRQSCTRHCLIVTWRVPAGGDQPCCQMLAGPGQRHPARACCSGAIEVPVQTTRCMQAESNARRQSKATVQKKAK